MRFDIFKWRPTILGRAASVLLLASSAAFAQALTPYPASTVDVGASLTTPLTLSAGASPIDPNSVNVTGVAPPFTVDASNCAAGVAANGSCTVNVTFSPTATGLFQEPLSTLNATSTTNGVVTPIALPMNLSGTGSLPTVTAANPLIFTDPGPGNISASLPVTLTLSNPAETSLAFTLSFSSGTYYVQSGCPSPLVLGGATPSCTANVVYQPQAGVDPSQSLTISSAPAGTGTPLTQLAQISLNDTNPGGVAVGPGGTVEVELAAVSTWAILNDGSTVPMWGYQCSVNSQACSPANPAISKPTTLAPIQPWSPVVITALPGQTLAIDLTNNLSFAGGANNVPTSLVIVGQLGGALGKSASYTASPNHAQMGVTWATVNTAGGSNPTFAPPPQPQRVQSFATEVPAGTTTRLVWNNLKAGTYLIESGTHPSIQGPMGLYGILVVTTPPTAPTATTSGAGIAYTGTTTTVNYNAEVPLLMSEIDPVQNSAVQAAVNTVGFSETATFNLQNGFVASVTAAPAGTGYKVGDPIVFTGGGGAGAAAQVAAVSSTGAIQTISVTNPGGGYSTAPSAAVTSATGTGASLTVNFNAALAPDMLANCSAPATACYPPAVNYTPLYYLINGVAFNKTNPGGSVFVASTGAATSAPSGSNMLVRLVNAGLRMHVPSIIGSNIPCTPVAPATTCPGGFALIAEDGNLLPGARQGVPSAQSEVFMAAGKTYDVMVQVPPPASATLPPPALAIYDRELSLSANAIDRDAGMLAYIGVNGAGAPNAAGFGKAMANNDTYNVLVASGTPAATRPFSVSDPSKGVIANDVNVYGVTLLTQATRGTVALNKNGTFTYTPNAGSSATSDSFSYCANGTVTTTGTTSTCSSGITATVTLGPGNLESSSAIGCSSPSFTSNTAVYVTIKPPGVLASCTDVAGYPLTVSGAAPGAPLTVALTGTCTPVPPATSCTAPSGTAVLDANGGFTATVPAAGIYTFNFQAQTSQGVQGASTKATITFQAASGLQVTVLDGYTKVPLTGGLNNQGDYRWIIEEDRTFYINPNCTQNPPPAGCPTAASGIVPTLGVNFHTSYMPFVAQGCTGPLSCEFGQTLLGNPTVCDVGNGACRPDTGDGVTTGGSAWVSPSQVHLDPTKRYYISVMPGDAADPFIAGYGGVPCGQPGADPTSCVTGHGMGGAPIGIDPNTGVQATSVTVVSQPSPYPPSQLSVFVFEDDFPLNGEHDAGGGVDVVAPNEPGLGGFEIILWDAMGGNGDFTGQMTHDMFNQPLSNALAGTIDPLTGLDACPISTQVTNNVVANAITSGTLTSGTQGATVCSTTAPCVCTKAKPCTGDGSQAGITGRIVTCPKFESDGQTLSPLAGQAVVANLMPMRVGVVANPAADRIARGEEWLQTNTLDGQKAHDAFFRIGEPSYFQEFGPAGYHVSIGFANPAIINNRLKSVCNGTNANITGTNCTNTITGIVTGERLSRPPDERLYSSSTHDAFYWTQCFVSVGDPDGMDFAFAKCDADGKFKLTGLPDGDWRITTFDQWNDQLVDGLSTPVRLDHTKNLVNGVPTVNVEIAATQWQTNLYTKTFIDDNKDGIAQATETGIPFANVAVRLRDGSLGNLLLTDFSGVANFNETFPLFSWYVVETDVTRYKNTGTHVVYDVGGPADGSAACGTTGYPPCGTSAIGKNLANTAEIVSVPSNLRIPGAIYCAGADCTGKDMSGLVGSKTSDPPSVCTTTAATSTTPPRTTCSTQLSSGRIDPPWVGMEGWQGFPGQNNFIEFGKAPYYEGENGGIHGHVVYASTRPFDDPQMLVQTQWEPLVPNVRINLYQEGFAADGVTPTLTLVDWTQTSSFDDWAQGFRTDANGNKVPNMNCPGQGAPAGQGAAPAANPPIPDLFFFSLFNQPQYLDWYNSQHGGLGATTLPYNSQFKCYDGMHNWNQIQPAPYDGAYQFPSVTSVDVNGRPNGTNCTICKNNPDPVPATGPDADPLRHGLPMLPPGKYVVEIVVPPGMELVKEEDKNILIGDDYIAPATQQFGGLGNIFILPDQASVAATFSAGAGYNAYNAQNPTQSFGAAPNNQIVPSFVPEPVWPCVGEARFVPDYISLFPQSTQVSPFAGAKRNLCDRKEVTLSDQMGAIAKFSIYTSTHIASKFTGGITDDYTSEFDPFSPQFGEKFAPPDLPISLKDWTGSETARVYADHWGAYNGMTYSTWEVNPPNPTGYSPTMMVFCMNDPGPILDTKPGSPTLGQMITDPLFAQGYSQFCYELPFMPGTTQYLDTPVVPTSAFAGAGYNNVDCAEPDATPGIKEVDGDGIGPWVSAAGKTLTITALGDQMVPNYAYSGPSATQPPYNQKTVKRHYGFGTCTLASAACTNGASAALNALNNSGATIPLNITSWSDTQITAVVPNSVAANPNFACPVQQQAQYGGPNGTTVSSARCGQLVITAANGKKSIDTVTVTVGGKKPTHVAASASIQAAIDAAAPGDLIIVDPTCNATTTATGATAALPNCQTALTAGQTLSTSTAAHNELLVMWKPVRLQGVGAWSSIINANTHPAGKLTPWRARIDCLFGLSPSGTPVGYDPSCGAGWNDFNPTANNPQVDRLPFESTVGWDANLNGNVAEQLQEPSLMGALEGAAITVVGKGVFYPSNPFDPTLLAGFPAGTVLFTEANSTPTSTYCNGTYPSNFHCNPSSIDGLGITDSSQGGGGIFVHAWGHHLQIANNRVYNNAGTLSGGMNIGQGEFPPSYTVGGTNSPPGSCETSTITGLQLPYCHNMRVNAHHNYISLNSSTGDELFSATPAGAGGVSICTGSDYYSFNYNWVCGNLSNGDGGGLGHLGFSKNGDIEHNSILFNQSTNPTIPTNGGGLIVMGTPDADPTCGANTDQDCVPPLGAIGPSDGIGPGLVINANLIMGNAAESGSGGGIAFQHVNGNDVLAFPNPNLATGNPGWAAWWEVKVTNNIIANNIAGWDGAGVSLLDSFRVQLVNNTIISNVTTATAGTLTNTLGAPLASTQNCPPPAHIDPVTGLCSTAIVTSTPQPAGLVSINNSAVLLANLPAQITCPPSFLHPLGSVNGDCRSISDPLMHNNVIYNNSPYYVAVGSLSAQFQQNVVTLYNGFTTTPAPTASTADSTTANGTGVIITGGTGACLSRSFWDIGVRGDRTVNGHESGFKLDPRWSVLTPGVTLGGAAGYNTNNLTTNPQVQSEYCNGSRQPPEACGSSGGGNNNGGCGWAVPPGIADATVPNPIFNLTPVATVDEGNNWINMRWGPLSLTNPTVIGADGNYGGGAPLGNYALASSSSAIDYIPVAAPENLLGLLYPHTDFFGNPRPDPSNETRFDVGAVEIQGAPRATLSFAGPSPALTTTTANTSVKTGFVTVTNTASASNAGSFVFTAAPTVNKVGTAGGTFSIIAGGNPQCTSTTVLVPGASCQIDVQYAPGTSTATATANVTVTGTGLATANATSPNFNAN